jgi:CRISPR-associated protein Csh1
VNFLIKDLVVGFEKAQNQYPSIVQDNYKLKDGIYIRLHVDQSWESQSATFDQNHLIIRVKEDAPINPELLDWFKRRDYYSSLIDMNKAVDGKKQVHSNNPFSLFVKRDVFLGEKQDNKYTMKDNIDRYLVETSYEQVKKKWLELLPKVKGNSGKGKDQKKEERSLGALPEGLQFFANTEYEVALAYLNMKERSQWIEKITQWYDINRKQLTTHIDKLSIKNYVKLFFVLDLPTLAEGTSCENVYALEYILYTIPKIYNSNDYNQIVHGEIIGLPSFDMTMNSKKPFMEHKTMRIEAPDRVLLQQALLAKQATEWLAVAQPKYTTNKIGYESGFIPPTGDSLMEGTFHVYMDGKYNELHSFENVPFPPTMPFDVEWHNVLQLKERNGDLKSYDRIINGEALQKIISSKFFRGRMNASFIFNVPDVRNKEFTAVMVALFVQSRQAFHDWFYKGTTISLRGIFPNITLRLLEEQLIHVESARITDLADAFNLRLSIEKFMNKEGGSRMGDRIKDIVDSLRDKLAGEGLAVCSTDDEFYFVAGQLAYYLTYQSEMLKKTGAMFEPFLRAKNGQQLKKRLEEVYMLYKHGVLVNYRKFNNAFSMVMGYVPIDGNEGNARELLLAGIFADNLMLEKKDKEV